MKMYPRKDSEMSVFLRFFEFVQSEIDDRATPKSNAGTALIGEQS